MMKLSKLEIVFVYIMVFLDALTYMNIYGLQTKNKNPSTSISGMVLKM